MLSAVAAVIPNHALASNQGIVINLAGKQRMLTQKMSKEIFLAASNENPTENLKVAKATAELFDRTLKGLELGNPDMGLPKAESPRIIRQLGKVKKLWTPFKESVDSVVAAGTVSEDAIQKIADLNVPLLKEMNKAVKLFEKEASDGTANNLAVTINLAGKQRMLTQRMSKEYLLIGLGHDEDTNKLNLMESLSLFDRTLKGLKEGDDVLELSASNNTPEISTQLADVSAKWQSFKLYMDKAAAEGRAGVTADGVRAIAKENIPLLKSMNKAVGLYNAAFKK